MDVLNIIGSSIFKYDRTSDNYKICRWSLFVNFSLILYFVFLIVYQVVYDYFDQLHGLLITLHVGHTCSLPLLHVIDLSFFFAYKNEFERILRNIHIKRFTRQFQFCSLALIVFVCISFIFTLMLSFRTTDFETVMSSFPHYFRFLQISGSSLHLSFFTILIKAQFDDLRVTKLHLRRTFKRFDELVTLSNIFVRLFSFHTIIQLYFALEINTLIVYQHIVFFVYEEEIANYNKIAALCALIVHLALLIIFVYCNQLGGICQAVSHCLFNTSNVMEITRFWELP